MKKIIIPLVLTLLLSASFLTPTSSYYSDFLTAQNGVGLYNDAGWVTFNESNFDYKLNGFYTLSGDTFSTSYSGLARLTLNCHQLKPSNITLRAVVSGYSLPVPIAQTNADVFTVVLPFIAGNMQIQGYNNDLGRYDVVQCYVLFEKVD